MSTLLEQASLVLIPSGYKEDTVYSVIPSNGSGDMSFTRASNGTRINSDGLVEVTPWNFILQSQTFNVGSWGYTNYTLTPNSTTAPDGTMTADLFTLNNGVIAGAGSAIDQGLTQLGQITMSVYFKNNNSTGYYIIQDGNGKGIQIDVSNPLSFTNMGVGSVGAVLSLENGWFRISTTITETSGYYFYSYQNGMTGNGIKGIYLWGAQLNIGSTAKPYFPTTDRLNVPRLTYQNGGGGCPSLLLEPQRTNLVTYSEQFDNVAWTKEAGGIASAPVVTANTIISPDGTQNADTVVFTLNGGTGSSDISQIRTIGYTHIANAYTQTIYAKTTDGSTKVFSFIMPSGDLIPITITGTWQRFSVTSSLAAVSSTFRLRLRGSASGEGTSSSATIALWGAQYELGSYQSSYIPTVASSATRIADACFKTGISSLIGATEGTLFYDLVFPQKSDASYIGVSNGTTANRIIFGCESNSFFIFGYGSTTLSLNVNTRYKIALAYNSTNMLVYINGVLTNTVTGTLPSGLSRLGFDSGAGTQNLISSVNSVQLYKTKLTNSELATLTTI